MSRHEDKTTQQISNRLINVIPDNALCIRKITGKRETWKASDANNTYYVKILFQNNLPRKLVSVLKQSKIYKELRAFKSLKEKGILIPELIDHGYEYGTMRLPKKEYIITKEVEGSLRLKDFFCGEFQELPRKNQKQIIADFAKYIMKLHDSGVMHLDPNLGNFLIKHKSGDKNKFYIVDLSDVRIKTALNLNERWNNLAYLNLNFFRTVPASLRYYFFKNYVHMGQLNKKDILKSIKTIEDRTLQLANKTWAKRMKWCMGSNSFFIAVNKGNLKIHIKKDWADNKDIQQVLSFPDVFLNGVQGTVLKDGKTVKASMVNIGEGQNIFLKRYNRKGWFHTFKNIFRNSRANRVWKISWKLELRRIPSPPSLAYMEDRRFRILKRSYFISEFMPTTEVLSLFFGQNKSKFASEEKLAILQEVGREIGIMHALGCLHGDLKWSNILIKKINARYKCFFTDFDGSKIRKHLSGNSMIRELSRFYMEMVKYSLCSDEKKAFLKSYYKHSHIELPYKAFIRKVESFHEKN